MPNFGTPLDPAKAPPRRVTQPRAASPPGRPIEVPPPSETVAFIHETALGLNLAEAAVKLPPGASPALQNVLLREGAAEPRLRLSALSSGNNLADAVLWVGEYSNVTGARFPAAISAGTVSFFTGGRWRTSNYSAAPANDPMSGANTVYLDAAVIYNPVLDQNNLCFVNDTDQAFVADGPSTMTFSTLTNAPIAKTVTAFDARVVFGNISSGGTRFPQRIQWSARGDPVTYAEPTGGFEDLMDARGSIQRIVGSGDRIVAFFDWEIWVGYKADFPFDFQFVPLDRTVGTGSPWSVTQVPGGIAFLGSDYKPYILPHGSTPQPLGDAVWRQLRDTIDQADRVTADYDPNTGEWVLAYPIKGGTGRCDRALSINLTTGAWAFHTYANPVTRLGAANLTSAGTTFGNLVGTFAQQTLTYGQLSGGNAERALLAGTSNGTVAAFLSSATNDLGQAVSTKLLLPVPNPDATKRLYLRELRLDYRATSASSVTIQLSDDFGASILQEIGVALPAAPISAQTVIPVGINALYPSVQFVSEAQRPVLQRLTVIGEQLGRGY